MVEECPSPESSVPASIVSTSDSKEDVEHICWEERAELIHFLIMKTDASIAPSMSSNVYELTY